MKIIIKRLKRYLNAIIISFGPKRKNVISNGGRPPFSAPDPQPLRPTSGKERFCGSSLINGCFFDPAVLEPDSTSNIVLEHNGRAECMKYYSCNLQSSNDIAMIQLHGDVISLKADGTRVPHPNYLGMTPNRILQQLKTWSDDTDGVPTIFMARPGTYGSSGDHEDRRTIDEIDIINQTLDAIKERHRIKTFLVMGQSGGGLVAAGLLERRNDILYAVLCSSVLDSKGHFAHTRKFNPIPAWPKHEMSKYYTPLEAANPVLNTRCRVYVVSDPRDIIVPLVFQRRYYNKLMKSGLGCEQIFAYARPTRHHDLSQVGKRLSSDIVTNGTKSIIQKHLNLTSQAFCDLTSKRYILVRNPANGNGSLDVCLEKNADEDAKPASLTKVLTAITALQIAKTCATSQEACFEVCASDIVGGSGSNLMVGDILSFGDAIANIILTSSNDTANMLARSLGDILGAKDGGLTGIDRFVSEMNLTADQIGMSSSAFKNASGLNRSGQKTTAWDIAILMLAASKMKGITDFWGAESISLEVNGPNKRGMTIKHTVQNVSDAGVCGAKTGTLIPGHFHIALMYATENGDKYSLVVLNSSNNPSRYTDARTLITGYLGPETALLSAAP